MATKMTTGIVQEQNNNNDLEKHIEKQMGCMAGFLQIFDRSQILTGKRLYSTTKRLPSSSPTVAVSSSSSPEPPSSTVSPVAELPRQKPSPERLNSKQSPELRSPLPEPKTPTSQSSQCPSKSPSTWKFSRDMPRLSLDSRATVDAKGSLHPKNTQANAALLSDNNHRSPSVIARLMGLEPLSQSHSPDSIKLRRSASESSRANKDLYHPARSSVDSPNPNSRLHQHQQQRPDFKSNNNADHHRSSIGNTTRQVDRKSSSTYNAKSQTAQQQRKKSFYDVADFFPEPNKQSAVSVSVYGEIEKRLRMRGIDDQSNDLETLKQILEALQLKGLLHSSSSRKQFRETNNNNHRNVIHNRFVDQSPIMVMRASRSPIRPARFGNESPPSSFKTRSAVTRRNSNSGGESQAASPRRGRPENVRNESPPRRSESGVRSPSRRGSLVIETSRKGSSDPVEHRRVSPVHSPKVTPRRSVSDQQSPRVRKPTAEMKLKEERVALHRAEEDSPTMSDSSMSNSTSSQTDTEKWNGKVEEYKEGRSLLERCDKLLNSIAELQPSPISVLDSSFYKEESSPSPVMKRSIDFKGEMEELWGRLICLNESESDDCDFVYVSEILRASNYLPEDVDVFLFLEKQQEVKGKGRGGSKLERRLNFDVVNEILDRNRQLLPWKAVAMQTSVPEIWSEFNRIREREESEDLFEVICGVLKKDLSGDAINGWGDYSIETSEAVLDIERLVFKDLIGETIQELATFSPNSGRIAAALCRKLVF